MLPQYNNKNSRWQYLNWLLGLAWLALICLTMALGAWQLRRADEKQQILQRIDAHKRHAISDDVVLLQDSDQRFRRLRLRGRFDTAHAVWQASQFHEHRLGYQIWMPFQAMDDSSATTQWVWVNLGWVPQGVDRMPQMPAWQPSKAVAVYEGTVDMLPSSRVPWMGQQAAPLEWPAVSVHPDWAMLNAHLRRSFYPLSWRLSAPNPTGWVRQHVSVVMPPVRHVGYAVQWFALALTLVLCGLWFIYKKER